MKIFCPFLRCDRTTDPNVMQTNMSNIEKIAANHIRNLIVNNSVGPLLCKTRPLPDLLEKYQEDFGSFGKPPMP